MPQEVGCPWCGLPTSKGRGPVLTQYSRWKAGPAWGMVAVPSPGAETPQPLPGQDYHTAASTISTVPRVPTQADDQRSPRGCGNPPSPKQTEKTTSVETEL